ncbi:MAG: GFA family protein [Woeseia sp.]
MKHTGGCLCGAVRYGSSDEPVEAGYCHCRMCQRLSGSAVLPWVSFATGSIAYTEGSPKIYKSSGFGQREFCPECGSQIAYRRTDNPATVEINAGTLDDPSAMMPEHHIWCDSQLPWFDTADDLPRYPEWGPGHVGS